MKFDQIEAVCRQLDVIGQGDTEAYRALERSRMVANWIINSDAALDKTRINKLLKTLHFPRLEEERHAEHIKTVLKYLIEDPRASRIYIRLTLPLANQWCEKLIRLSLNIPDEQTLKSRDVRVAVISALMTPLRQTVGSCFATAPAILVQIEQIDRMYCDIHELLSRGQLRRVIRGNEFKVPLSISSGSSDLFKPVVKPDKIAQHPALQGFFTVAPTRTHLVRNVGQLIEQVLCRKHDLSPSALKNHPKPSHSPFFAPTTAQLSQEKKIADLKAEEKKWREQYAHFSSHALLRAWEYTIASLADYQDAHSKRNLTVGLGLEPDSPGGIGELLYSYVEKRLGGANQRVQEMHSEYVLAHDRVEMTQRLLANADSEQKARRLKAELQAHLHHMQACFDEREASAGEAKHLSELFNYVTKQYFDHFRLYFQELYDPDMQDVDLALFEDSPAGFRLVYKHGRAEPSVWTAIHTEQEYLQSLRDFFMTIEPFLISGCEWDKASQEIPLMTQLVVDHIETEAFIQSAHGRIIHLHKQTTGEAAGKTPWAYISGGTIETLINCYYSREGEISTEKFVPKNPTDLCIFLIDLMKEMPLQITEKSKRLLMVSPNHAFIFLPQSPLLKRAWESDQFTYTWVRDHLIEAHSKYYSELFLTTKEQVYLLKRLYHQYPHLETKHVKFITDHLSLREFAAEFPTLHPQEMASFLKSSLPLVSIDQAEQLCHQLGVSSDKIAPFTPFPQLVDQLIYLSGRDESDIEAFLQLCNVVPPKPLIFADTNWPGFYFAFQVNPLTHQLELWRTSANGFSGAPMTQWNHLFTVNPKHYWAVFTRPFEYGGTYVPVPTKLFV